MPTRKLLSRIRFAARPTQFGVLPFRKTEEGLRIMLVTSRSSGSWILPKGWLTRGLAPHISAAKEAYEEAGLRGVAGETSIGAFFHVKSRTQQTVLVEVFPLEVTEQLEDWPERVQRRRQWFSVHQAARAVNDSTLRRMIRSFAP